MQGGRGDGERERGEQGAEGQRSRGGGETRGECPDCRLSCLATENVLSNLVDYERQVGAGEADARSWHTVSLDVRRYMLMMGKRTGQ